MIFQYRRRRRSHATSILRNRTAPAHPYHPRLRLLPVDRLSAIKRDSLRPIVGPQRPLRQSLLSRCFTAARGRYLFQRSLPARRVAAPRVESPPQILAALVVDSHGREPVGIYSSSPWSRFFRSPAFSALRLLIASVAPSAPKTDDACDANVVPLVSTMSMTQRSISS